MVRCSVPSRSALSRLANDSLVAGAKRFPGRGRPSRRTTPDGYDYSNVEVWCPCRAVRWGAVGAAPVRAVAAAPPKEG